MMKTYKRYKPSGVEWIGDIPEHWDMKKVSRSFQIIGSGTTPASGNSEYYIDGTINWINTGDLNDGILHSCKKKITEEAFKNFSTLKIYPLGTLLIAMYGATIGKVSLLNFEACTNQACCALAESEIFDSKYILYWFLSSRKDIINLSYGGGQPNISQEIIRSLKIISPPLPEQTAIANYLDEKTAQLDKLVEGKRGLIALLKEERSGVINHAVTRGINPHAKLKPSGIDWLGEIPEHWEVKKLKWVCQITDCKHTTPIYIETGIPVVSTGNVKPKQISFESARKVSQSDFEQLSEGGRKPTKNDIIYSRNASVGAAALVRTEEDFCLGQDICLVRSNQNQEFLENVLNGSYLLAQLESVLVGSTFRRINIQQIKDFEVALPSVKEQKQIVQFIETETDKIDMTISKIEKEIEYLREYRTALISEVVTGKIKVA